MNSLPRVSVVIPCLNEARTIGWCLDSVLASDYPADRLEVIVADGGSTDGTRAILDEYAGRDARVRVVDNPLGSIPGGLNAAIRSATGEIIVRMDAHCSFAPGYIGACVSHLEATGADAVGGRIETVGRHNSLMGRAVATAMATSFGVGGSTFRTTRGGDPVWTESVPFPCYRREVFDRVGLFNVRMLRSEDAEHQSRMRARGHRTLFVPALVNKYYARSDLWSVIRHAFDNGRWAILPTRFTGHLVVSLRHLVPLFFVTAIVAFGLAAPFAAAARYALAAVLGSYAAAALAASAMTAWQHRAPALFLLLPVVFAALHLSYGAGSLAAVPEVLWHRVFQPAETEAST